MRLFKVLIIVGVMAIVTQVHAGNGDLIVDGKIGVGTISPGNLLHVGATTNFGIDIGKPFDEMNILVPVLGEAGRYDIRFYGWRDVAPNQIGSKISAIRRNIYLPNNALVQGMDLALYTTNSSGNNTYGFQDISLERMRINYKGYVGIGTPEPTNVLHIAAQTNTGIDIGKPHDGMNINVPAGGESGRYDIRFYGWRDVTPNQIGSKISAIRRNIYVANNALAQGMDLVFYTTNSWGDSTGNFQDTSIERMRINYDGNVSIGSTDPQGYKLNVAGSFYASSGPWGASDVRFKKNIRSVTDSLSKITRVNAVTYEWKTEEYKDRGFPEGRHYGVIAQEIEKVLPEVVNTAADGTKAVAYTEIIPVLIEAIKEQQKEIELLKKKVSELLQSSR